MSTGQALGGVVGAAAGFVLSGGNPMGAVYGAQIGMMAGGYLDPPKGPTMEGPRLSDLSVQTSTYGAVIPRVYGTIAINGNIFWLENNKLKETAKKKKTGGKGGGSKTTTITYSYTATFAVGLCRGPIAGIKRVWVGPDLVYDSASSDAGTSFMSGKARVNFKLYKGDDTQQPDSRMQAEIGAANCPAYRGLAYLVIYDLPLEKYGNSLAGAPVKVEVETSATAAAAIASDVLVPRTSGDEYTVSMPCVSDDGTAHIFIGGTYYKQHLAGSLEPVRFIASSSRYLQCTSDQPYMIIKVGSTHEIYNANGVKQTTIMDSHIAVNMQEQTGQYYIYGSDIYVVSISATTLRVSKTEIGQGIAAPLIVIYESDLISASRVDDIYPVGGMFWCITKDSKIELRDSSFAVVWSVSTGLSGGAGWGGGTRRMIRATTATDCLLTSLSNPSETYQVTQSGITLIGNVGLNASWFNAGIGGLSLVGGSLMLFTNSSNPGPCKLRLISLNRTTSNQVNIGSIVSAETQLSGLIGPTDIDMSALTQNIDGFMIASSGSIRAGIEPLRGAYPFDLIQSGYKIRGVRRGGNSVATIAYGELGPDEQMRESVEMDSQLPAVVSIKYYDKQRGYDENEQRAMRDNTVSVNRLNLDVPIVMTATESARVADVLLRLYQMERSSYSFKLPPTYAHLEPADCVVIDAPHGQIPLRVTTIGYGSDGVLTCEARPSNPATYASAVVGDNGQDDSAVIPVYGSSTGYLIDCAVIDETLQDAPGFVSAMHGHSDSWPGGTIFRSADGADWDALQSFSGPVTTGTALTALSANSGLMIQRGGSLSVKLYVGDLFGVTESAMLNGANVCAYGAPGRWEIIRFIDATLEVDGTYTLSGFWRGDRGTEWATGLHVAGDRIILMNDPDAAFVPVSQDQIGVTRDYRAITSGADIDGELSTAYQYTGENLRPLAGAHPVGTRSAGDLTITWKRRTRVGGAWRDYVDASLGETSESYSIDIMSGSIVKRTLTATTPSVLYTSAQQTTDFGSPQASVVVRIYQLSPVVGRGYKLEATL